MAKTKIEWASDVWNPTVGCTKVSEGCKNCYAERIFNRFHPDEKFSEVRCYPERLDQPLHWKKPRRVFVDSMSDLFHPEVPDGFICDMLDIIEDAKQHTYMILTKRPRRMAKIFAELDFSDGIYPNLWLGVSAENQKAADERIPWLLKTPAAIRFVSVEPMLGKLDLLPAFYGYNPPSWGYAGIDWVICGSESGLGARPMYYEWVAELRDDCELAGIPFFLKQMTINGKLVKMPELDGKVWDELPT